ncbi:HNH endonuclease [Mangrovimonas sp. TPBH4]|uniref:HNH endonuclease n=1 Tax=Mangrovimonas sp. TPBH4 TaxID=1645914 RepID=UPI0006B56F89|nr:HNH endonuclease [Mangrovimonas sp. TPBH4]
MNDALVTHYANDFKNLKRGYNKGLGKAPHKPILLVSIIELIQKKTITSNRIYITSDLLLAFKNNWNKLVDTKHSPNFALPFFHMRSEPFWHLVTYIGLDLKLTSSKSIKSFKSLNETIAFAEIDKVLFEILSTPPETNILLQLLLDQYFPDTKTNFYAIIGNETESKIEQQILHEESSVYQHHIWELRATLNDDEFEEELFIRGGLFKKAIPKIYNFSCCISDMKVISTTNAQMVDACHIVPFSISKNDTIPNGISLSPNLHRAFDRGLITINKDYIVRVSPTVSENDSVYSISQFDGKQIKLPNNIKHYPSPESLTWHNKEIYAI